VAEEAKAEVKAEVATKGTRTSTNTKICRLQEYQSRKIPLLNRRERNQKKNRKEGLKPPKELPSPLQPSPLIQGL